MKENIKWIFFDMGGVLLDDTKPEALRQELILKLSLKYFPEITMADIYHAWLEASKQPGSVRINALRYIFQNSPFIEEAESTYKAQYNIDYYGLSTIRPEAKRVLSKLSQQYYLGIMANQSTKALDALQSSGLVQYLSHQKMSAHTGFEKPDIKFYLKILTDSGALAEQSMLIDDNWYRGLLGAKTIGMKTILFKRNIMPYPETAQADFSISSLEELLNILI